MIYDVEGRVAESRDGVFGLGYQRLQCGGGRLLRRNGWLTLFLGLWACAPDGSSPSVGERSESIVYGDDDRREVYEVEGPERDIARASVVALIPKPRIQRPASGELRLTAPTLKAAYDLCDDQRFLDQPTAADCTGVLIDDDLVLTAAHCFESGDCSTYFYAFDYFYRGPKQLERIGSNDLYTCQRIVAQEMSERNGRLIDYAVVQLDRPVADRKPIAIRDSVGKLEEPLTVLGMTSGLPLKVDSAAHLIAERAGTRDYFMLEADTFEGSSGSAIVDAQGALLGILVRGGLDYVLSSDADCQVVNTLPRALVVDLPDGQLAHEEGTYALNGRDGVCAKGFPSQRLCGVAPVCGDGFCSLREDRESCPDDCDPCGDGACGARGTLRSTQADQVKQMMGSGRAKSAGGCAVGGAAGATSEAAVLVLALGFARRRRRALSRRAV